MELFAFDQVYFERLRAGDAETEKHFVAYFSELLGIKLRARRLDREVVNDLRQETFSRVLAAVRREGSIRQPERLGAFVNSVCNNVLLEFFRSSSRNQPFSEETSLPDDKILNLEELVVSRQTQERVRTVLGLLPRRDAQILRALFLEEKDKDQICREFGTDRDYLRVLLHRAKERFRALFLQSEPMARQGLAQKSLE